MSKVFKIIFLYVLCLILMKFGSEGVKWDYTLLSIEFPLYDKDIFIPHIKAKRVSKGYYAINGTATLKVDLDSTFSGKADLYRSPTGNSQYVLTPFKLAETDAIKFIDTYYKEFIKDSIRNCSNLIYFEDKWNKPFPKGEYYFKNCFISNEKLPERIQSGYYKLEGSLLQSNKAVATVVAIVEVESKNSQF